MKKKGKFLKIAGLACLMLPGMFFMTACGEKPQPHSHNYSTEWSSNDTHHFYECDGCNEITGSTQHSFGNWEDNTQNHKKTCDVCGKEITANHNYGTTYEQWDGIQHKRTCADCGREKYETHTFGNWAPDATDPDLHARVCADCGYVSKMDHNRANPFADCSVCGDQLEVNEIVMDDSNFMYSEGKSGPLTAVKDRKYAFKFTVTRNDREFYAEHIKFTLFQGQDFDYEVPTSTYSLEYYEVVDGEIDLDYNCFEDYGQYEDYFTLNTYERGKTYIGLVTINDTTGWHEDEWRDQFRIDLRYEDVAHRMPVEFPQGNSSNHNIILYRVPEGLPAGTKIYFKPIWDNVAGEGLNDCSIAILDTDGTITTGVKETYCEQADDGEGFILKTKAGASFYIVLHKNSGVNNYGLANVHIVADKTIATSTGSAPQSATITGAEARKNYTFEYTANSVAKSTIKFEVQGPASKSDYAVMAYRTTETGHVAVPLTYDGSRYHVCNETNLAGKKIYIMVVVKTAVNITVEVHQVDTIVVTRDLNGGTFTNNVSNDPFEMIYGKNYADSHKALGWPLKDGYVFAGWKLTADYAPTDKVITNEQGLFSSFWSNNNEYDYYHKNGEVTIIATYTPATKRATLNVATNGGTFSADPSGEIDNINLETDAYLLSQYRPTKEGYTFMGYYKCTLNGGSLVKGEMIVDGEYKVVANHLINENEKIYAFFAENKASVDEITITGVKKYYAIKNMDWGELSNVRTRIEILGIDKTAYIMVVYDKRGNVVPRAVEGEFVYDLWPSFTYFVEIRKNGGADATKTIVVTREPSTDVFEYDNVYVLNAKKYYLRVNAQSKAYQLLIENGSNVPATNITSVKLYDNMMSDPQTITQTSTGLYDFTFEEGIYYIEIIFSSNTSGVNFILS